MKIPRSHINVVAKAICESEIGCPSCWRDYVKSARAAIWAYETERQKERKNG